MARAVARVDLDAVAHNVRTLAAAASGARLCAVVKANAYGHGAEACARAAQAAGADWLAVAGAAEAASLREAGVGGRLLVMGSLDDEDLGLALAADADIVVWDEAFLAALPSTARVHVKLDSGMGRLGTRDPVLATRLVEQAGARLAGAMTHFATADDRADPFMDEQLQRFTAWVGPLRAARPELVVHAANSAAILREPAAHFDMVRPGVALYGLDPFGEDAAAAGLRPALALVSHVAAVKRCRAGESTGYGRRFVADRDTVLATVPVGYGDGWRRATTGRADVLVGGTFRPQVGTVSMDNITVDLGPAGLDEVAVGDEVVLVGPGLSAEEVAARSETINYEVTTALLPRTARAHHRSGIPAG
ncbi:alanine racemase [Paraconexibacter antarcticus]|uniref:Alanine racemase n=1 Tax=Paraconexibacter antarcticus TaxID=2949664 RepID=A0ABY5E1A3_9ACTN|nr:alanine racemase [Paraconexibacter antarcticus]UTI66989.1 alanine racemase [Paraconexibacter antarcticus]